MTFIIICVTEPETPDPLSNRDKSKPKKPFQRKAHICNKIYMLTVCLCMTSLLTDLSSPSCCSCRSPWPPPSLPPPGWPPPRGTRCSSSTSWSYAWASSPPGGGPLTGPKLGARQPSGKAGSGHWSAATAALAYWSFKGPATTRPPKISEAHPPSTQETRK